MPEPITREEVYLNAIAQNTGGGSAGAVPEPITREEHYLNQIVTNTAGGGGGGSSLPAVTSDDNGDVLAVVDGAWAKATPSGGVLVVGADMQTGALDKTWQEIFDADFPVLDTRDEYSHNWTPISDAGIDNGTYYVLVGMGGSQVQFTTDSANGYPVIQM